MANEKEKERFSSKEAAQWLLDHGAPGSEATLQKWRSHGQGPAYHRIGRNRIVYDVKDLSAFAEGKRVNPSSGY